MPEHAIRILRMAEALAQIGHEVHVVTYHLGAGPASAALRIHRTPSWPATGISGLDRPWQAFRAGSVAGRQTGRRAAAIPDRYCSCPSLRGPSWPRSQPGSSGAAVAARIPVVYDAHTLLASELPYYGPGLLPRATRTVGRKLDHWLPKWSDHIIAVTELIRDKLMRWHRSGPDHGGSQRRRMRAFP